MDKAKTEEIIEKICQEIGGDWLLVGGTLVQVHYNADRATEDIDLFHIRHETKSRENVQNELFKYTMKRFGMGPEYINLAVEFFIQNLEGWENEILVLKKGEKGTVFRPSVTLFCALKALRASTLDQKDIMDVLQAEKPENLNFHLLQKWLSQSKFEWLKGLVQKH